MTGQVADLAAVAVHELRQHGRRRSFWIATLSVPVAGLVMSVVAGGAGVALGRGMATAFEAESIVDGPAARRVGYVDPGQFIRRSPPDSADEFLRLPDEAAAREAVASGAVDVAFILDADYPRQPGVIRVSPGFQVAGSDQRRLYSLLRANLWPTATAAELNDVAEPGKRVDLALDLQRLRVERGDGRAILLPLILGVLLYSSIFTVSSFLLQSLTTEKENRVLEVLLTSVNPLPLLAGKIIGLGALGLGQVLIWSGLAAGAFNIGALALLGVAGLTLGPTALALTALYFLAGYFFFASMMGAIGTLVPTFRESGALTFVVLFPAWLPFFLLRSILSDPGGGVARLLTFLPPTAPLTGVLRAASGALSWWEALASLSLLVVAGAAVLVMAAKLFSAAILLAGTTPSPAKVWAALRGT